VDDTMDNLILMTRSGLSPCVGPVRCPGLVQRDPVNPSLALRQKARHR
jgi:hypothetical protein